MNISDDITLKEIRARGYSRNLDIYQYPPSGRMWLDVRALLFMVEDLDRELRRLRQHVAGCARCETVEDHDHDKAVENR